MILTRPYRTGSQEVEKGFAEASCDVEGQQCSTGKEVFREVRPT